MALISKLTASFLLLALFSFKSFAGSNCTGFPQVNDPEEVKIGKVKVLASEQLIEFARAYIFQALGAAMPKNSSALANISLVQKNEQYCYYLSSFYWQLNASVTTHAGTHLNIRSVFDYGGGQTREALLAMEIHDLEDASVRDSEGNVRTRIYRFDLLLGGEQADTGCWRDSCGTYFKPSMIRSKEASRGDGRMVGIALVQPDGYVVATARGAPKVRMEFRVDPSGVQTLKMVSR